MRYSLDSKPQKQQTLVVSSGDPSVEIVVFDGAWRAVAQGLGQINKELPIGLYKVIASLNRNSWDEIISLGDEIVRVNVPPLTFRSAIPIQGMPSSRESHIATAKNLSSPTIGDRAETAQVSVLSRNWSPLNNRDELYCRPFLEMWRGDELQKISDIEPALGETDAAAGFAINVRPGTYVLRLETEHSIRNQIVHAIDGWRTEVFVLSDFNSADLDQDQGPRVDVVLSMSKEGFEEHNSSYSLLEAARTALADERPVIPERLLTAIASGKFNDPILGLMAAHILLIAKHARNSGSTKTELSPILSFDQIKFDNIVSNSARLLGDEHPDIVALNSMTKNPPDIIQITTPPIFWRSWLLLIEASNRTKKLISERLWHRIRSGFDGTPYLSWHRAGAPTAIKAKQIERRIEGLFENMRFILDDPASDKNMSNRFEFPPGTPKFEKRVSKKPEVEELARWAHVETDFVAPDTLDADEMLKKASTSMTIPRSIVDSVQQQVLSSKVLKS